MRAGYARRENPALAANVHLTVCGRIVIVRDAVAFICPQQAVVTASDRVALILALISDHKPPGTLCQRADVSRENGVHDVSKQASRTAHGVEPLVELSDALFPSVDASFFSSDMSGVSPMGVHFLVFWPIQKTWPLNDDLRIESHQRSECLFVEPDQLCELAPGLG